MSWEDSLKKEKLKSVGFWNNARNDFPHFPMPVENSPNYDKEKMITYIKTSGVIAEYRGISSCRFNCNEKIYDNPEKTGSFNWKYKMGSKTFSDGVYQYPQGLEHYIDIHEIELPQDFVNHVQAHNYDPFISWEKAHPDVDINKLKQFILLSHNRLGPSMTVLQGLVGI